MASEKALFLDGNAVWVTNGTRSGTFQLPVTADPGYTLVEFVDNFSYYFHPIGDRLLFAEVETGPSGEKIQLYTTNGTKAGTTEIASVPDNDLTTVLFTALTSYNASAEFGTGKMLILDSLTDSQGERPKMEFLVTNGTKTGNNVFYH